MTANVCVTSVLWAASAMLVSAAAQAQANSRVATLAGTLAPSESQAVDRKAPPQLILLWRDDAGTRALLDSACSISRRDPATWRTMRRGPDDATRSLSRGAGRYAPLLGSVLAAIVDTAWTDSEGHFAFHDLPPGTYYVFTEMRTKAPQIDQWWRSVSLDGSTDTASVHIYGDRRRVEQFCRPQIASADSIDSTIAYRESQVDVPARGLRGQPLPRYPDDLRAAGVEADVDVEFVVDTTGRADMRTFAVIDATDPRFVTAVKDAVQNGSFASARIGDRRVRQVMPLVVTFTISH